MKWSKSSRLTSLCLANVSHHVDPFSWTLPLRNNLQILSLTNCSQFTSTNFTLLNVLSNLPCLKYLVRSDNLYLCICISFLLPQSRVLVSWRSEFMPRICQKRSSAIQMFRDQAGSHRVDICRAERSQGGYHKHCFRYNSIVPFSNIHTHSCLVA